MSGGGRFQEDDTASLLSAVVNLARHVTKLFTDLDATREAVAMALPVQISLPPLEPPDLLSSLPRLAHPQFSMSLRPDAFSPYEPTYPWITFVESERAEVESPLLVGLDMANNAMAALCGWHP